MNVHNTRYTIYIYTYLQILCIDYGEINYLFLRVIPRISTTIFEPAVFGVQFDAQLLLSASVISIYSSISHRARRNNAYRKKDYNRKII